MGYWVWNAKLVKETEQERAVSTTCYGLGWNPENAMVLLEIVLSPQALGSFPGRCGVCVCVCAEQWATQSI